MHHVDNIKTCTNDTEWGHIYTGYQYPVGQGTATPVTLTVSRRHGGETYPMADDGRVFDSMREAKQFALERGYLRRFISIKDGHFGKDWRRKNFYRRLFGFDHGNYIFERRNDLLESAEYYGSHGQTEMKDLFERLVDRIDKTINYIAGMRNEWATFTLKHPHRFLEKTSEERVSRSFMHFDWEKKELSDLIRNTDFDPVVPAYRLSYLERLEARYKDAETDKKRQFTVEWLDELDEEMLEEIERENRQ